MSETHFRFIDQREAQRILEAEGSVAFLAWLDQQQTTPDLVSRKTAAAILGVEPPHITRYIKQGVMPEAIEVDGGNPAYVRDDVIALAGVIAPRLHSKKKKAEK